MKDVVVVLILLAIITFAVFYMVKEKKKGRACMGCPNASECGKRRKCAD